MKKSFNRKLVYCAFTASIVTLSSANVTAQLSDYNLNLDANIEIDTDAIKVKDNSTEYSQGGRVEVNFTAERKFNEYYVRAKGTGLLQKSGETATDDMWLMFGNHLWALQAGRFETTNLFPLGKDTLVYHAGAGEAQVYEANFARGRVSDGGQFAFHLTPSDNLSFELGTQFGGGDKTTAISGVRPAVTFGNDAARVSVGLERLKYTAESGDSIHKEGYGIALSGNYAGGGYNLALAQMKDKEDSSINKVTSVTANMTYGAFGAGVIHSLTDRSVGNDPKVTTAYAAYTLPLFDIQNASVTFAGSVSTASNVSSANDASGLRMRFNYTF